MSALLAVSGFTGDEEKSLSLLLEKDSRFYQEWFVIQTNPFFLPIILLYKIKSEKARAPHSSTLAWKIPWMEEPGRLQSMGSLRVGHD